MWSCNASVAVRRAAESLALPREVTLATRKCWGARRWRVCVSLYSWKSFALLSECWKEMFLRLSSFWNRTTVHSEMFRAEGRRVAGVQAWRSLGRRDLERAGRRHFRAQALIIRSHLNRAGPWHRRLPRAQNVRGRRKRRFSTFCN